MAISSPISQNDETGHLARIMMPRMIDTMPLNSTQPQTGSGRS